MLELLLKIAQEKVGCDFDYYKGYNLLKDSLEGLDEQTINKLLIGEYSLKYTDNNKGEVVDVPQTNPLNILSLIECKLNSIATLYDKGKLDRYIITQLELDKLSEIHPSLLCCNAGYFAPDGKYYGLNGTKANFLHIKIADLLQQQGIIPKDCNTPDRWLEEHGWIKQSSSMLLYGGYFYNIPITKEQITSIERILSQSYNYIELQHIENSIPVTRLSEIEDIQLRKHFS
jgi:hypothetical protein